MTTRGSSAWNGAFWIQLYWHRKWSVWRHTCFSSQTLKVTGGAAVVSCPSVHRRRSEGRRGSGGGRLRAPRGGQHGSREGAAASGGAGGGDDGWHVQPVNQLTATWFVRNTIYHLLLLALQLHLQTFHPRGLNVKYLLPQGQWTEHDVLMKTSWSATLMFLLPHREHVDSDQWPFPWLFFRFLLW